MDGPELTLVEQPLTELATRLAEAALGHQQCRRLKVVG
jgi:hypothetical protein